MASAPTSLIIRRFALRGCRPSLYESRKSLPQIATQIAKIHASTKPSPITTCEPLGQRRRQQCKLSVAKDTRALFRTNSRQAILPAEPQVIEGTANDPAPVPSPHPTHGSYHWTFERLISAALVPVTIAPFAAGTLHPAFDAILCATILIHSHIGFQSVIIDYIPKKRLPKTRSLFWWGLRAGTIVVAIGLYEFETNDVGLTEAIKRIWMA